MKRFLFLLAAVASCFAQARMDLAWGPRFDEPGTGVARPFAGVSNGRVLLAGGANFPGVPLAKGGPKVYHDDILACDPSAERPSWTPVGRLPCPWGEGAYATTPKGVVCVSGATGRDGAAVTNGCFLMAWDATAGKVVLAPLPPFPEAAKYPAAAARGNRVYAVGTRKAAWLDLDAASPAWTPLPDLPEAVFQPACAVQNAAGGRTAFFVFAEHGREALSGGWRIDLAPTAGATWSELPFVKTADKETADAVADRRFVGALAVPSGCQHILFFGGTSRAVAEEAQRMTKEQYLEHGNAWFRFPRRVLAYHTVTETWFALDEAEICARAGAAAVKLPDGRILLAGGEVGPGVRSPESRIGAFRRPHAYAWSNVAVIVVYLLGMALMGVYFMRRNKSADDYFRAGGKLPWWVVSLSIYATMFSSITFISVPAMSYLDDCRYYVISFGIILLAPVVAKWYLPFFRKLNLTSAYEFLEVRFNLACRLFASTAFILFMVARTAVVTYLPAIAIAAVTDIDLNVAILAVTVVTIFYCTIGGVEAVIWSDFVQSIILIGSTAMIIAFLVCGTDGGFSGFVSTGLAADKFRVFDFAFDWTRPCFWVVLIGGLVANLASYTSDQCVVQRYMTTPDERGAAKSILFNGVLSFINCFVFFVMGVALWTFYRSNPSLLDASMAKNDAVLPLFIGNDLPTGLSGLVLAAVAAATMSTLSANLNSAASAITTDFYQRLVASRGGSAASQRSLLLCGKVSTVVVGVLGGAMALWLANADIGNIYDQFQRFLGILTGGLGCLFFMGIFMKRVNGFGATCGLVANYLVCFGLDQIQFAGKPHLLTFGFLGMLACLVVAPLASALFRTCRSGK